MLELRHDETNEVFVSSGNVGRGNDKTIARAFDQPLFELVGNLLRAADDRIMNPAAAAEVRENRAPLGFYSRWRAPRGLGSSEDRKYRPSPYP